MITPRKDMYVLAVRWVKKTFQHIKVFIVKKQTRQTTISFIKKQDPVQLLAYDIVYDHNH